MTLTELQKLKTILTSPDTATQLEIKEALDIINREIKLKTLDPRMEK